MSSSPHSVNDLLTLVQKREHATRWRVLVLSTIPVVLAAVLLWLTGQRIRAANAELASVDTRLAIEQTKLQQAELKSADLERQYNQAQTDLQNARDQVDVLQKQLKEAMDYRKDIAVADPAILMKYIGSRYPRQGELLIDMFQLQHRGVGWKAGGSSEQEGFDSPSFAAYLLERHHLLPRPASEVRYHLRDVLPSKQAPEVGDLVFYSFGYTMFFYRDDQQRPFVAGMTPFGILALRVDFAQIVGYAGVTY